MPVTGTAAESSRPGLGPSDLKHPHFHRWRNATIHTPKGMAQKDCDGQVTTAKSSGQRKRWRYLRPWEYLLYFKRIYWVKNRGAADGGVRALRSPSRRMCSQAWHGENGHVLLSHLRCPCSACPDVPTLGFPESTPTPIRGWLLHPEQSCYPHPRGIKHREDAR